MNDSEMFFAIAAIGKQLMDLHLNYEQAPLYPLEWRWNPGVPKSWRVVKMHLSRDRSAVVVNESLTLAGIPPQTFEYRLGDRSALEWVIDQYQVTIDKRSGIISDPNGWNGDETYIANLVCRVVHVSVETVRLQHVLEQITGPEDWVGLDLEQEDPSQFWQK